MIFFIYIALACGSSYAQVVSGANDTFVVGVDPQTREITGHIYAYVGFDDTADGPQFSCIFYLHGIAKGEHPYLIDTWFPGYPEMPVKGTMSFSSADATPRVTIHLEDEPDGCWNVEPFSSLGSTQNLEKSGAWSSVRVVSSKHTYFYKSASASQKQRGYVTTGDVLRVYEHIPGWVRAEYVADSGKTSSGWVREIDLFSSLAPER